MTKDERESIMIGGKMNNGNKVVMWMLFLFLIVAILTIYSHEVIEATEYGELKPITADELHHQDVIIHMNSNVSEPSIQVITHQIIHRDMWRDWEVLGTQAEIHIYIP